ncbi:MAG: sulfite exporter TauE/SafE family protein [Cystobacterineae bacterium]|nr:sulfite exporter TauE/SafE family protein [Cystobacterineae bacterium]
MTISSSIVAYAAAFLTGLWGSAHCLGMCGGLVSAFFMRPGLKGSLPYFSYHGARLAVYAFLGFAAAALGSFASQGQLGLAQAVLQIIAGSVVVFMGMELVGLWRLRLGSGFVLSRWLGRGFAKAMRQGPLWGAAMAGMLNGFMPCTMTMAQAAHAATFPPLGGMLLLLSFGAGTLPSMLLASWLLRSLGARAREWLLKAAGVVVILMGVVNLWNGVSFFLVLHGLNL